MTKVSELVQEIRSNLNQTYSSTKDEERVMRAMLNDQEYSVGLYSKEGKVGEFNPSESARSMIASVISATTGVSKDEAQKLANDHVFRKSESQSFVDISKEFVNTYTQTGRKLPIGGREKSDVALSLKELPDRIVTYPKKIGVNPDGSSIYENGEVKVKAHNSLKVHSSCPEWIGK